MWLVRAWTVTQKSRVQFPPVVKWKSEENWRSKAGIKIVAVYAKTDCTKALVRGLADGCPEFVSMTVVGTDLSPTRMGFRSQLFNALPTEPTQLVERSPCSAVDSASPS